MELILSTDSRDTNRQGTPLTILQITVSKKKKLIKRQRQEWRKCEREKQIICIRVRLARGGWKRIGDGKVHLEKLCTMYH